MLDKSLYWAEMLPPYVFQPILKIQRSFDTGTYLWKYKKSVFMNTESLRYFEKLPPKSVGSSIDFTLFPVRMEDVKQQSWLPTAGQSSFQCKRQCGKFCEGKKLGLQTEVCANKDKECLRPRAHAGCDIYVHNEGAVVRSVARGKIKSITPNFIDSQSVGQLQAILIEHYAETIPVLPYCLRYCEILINPYLSEGADVVAGDILGWVHRVAHVTNPMLHIEMYPAGTKTVTRAEIDKTGICKSYCRSVEPLDPSPILAHNYAKADRLEKEFLLKKSVNVDLDITAYKPMIYF